MNRSNHRVRRLLLLMVMATFTLGPLVALRAQDAPKEAAKPDPGVGKQGAHEDMATRIQKLEQTVQRLEFELRTRQIPPWNPMGIVFMAQTFAFIGMSLGALAFLKASKLKKELDVLRKNADKPTVTEGPGLTNG